MTDSGSGICSDDARPFARVTRNGTLLCQQNLNGTANDLGQAFSVAVDNQGNVLAAGNMRNTTFWDFTVAKFDRNGTPLWQQNLNGAATILTKRGRWRWRRC